MALAETYTFEEGTNGNTVTTASGFTAVSGTPKYSTAAAIHGSMGMTTAGAQYVSETISSSFQVSIYGSLTVAPASGAGRLFGLMSGTNTFQGAVRTHQTGDVFDICNAGATQLATSGAVTWTLGQKYRIDVRVIISGTSITMEVHGFLGSNIEGTTPDFTIGPTTYTASATVNKFFIGSNAASWTYTFDTVRRYDDVTTWPAPFVASTTNQTASETNSLAVSESSSVVIVSGVSASDTGAISTSEASSVSASVGGVTTYSYEEGTNGATASAPTGSTSVFGSPIYSTAAAIHGSLGIRITGNQNITYALPASSFSMSLYTILRQSQGTGTARPIAILSGGSVIAWIRFHNDGKFDIADSGAARVASTTTTWAVDEPVRFDIQAAYTTSNLDLTLRVFKGSNFEGTTPTEEINITVGVSGAPTAIYVGNNINNWNLDIDTLRVYDALLWAGPYASATPKAGTDAASISVSDSSSTSVITLVSKSASDTGSVSLTENRNITPVDNSDLYDFEEGTDGATVTAPPWDYISGTPTYSAEEAIHGSLGMETVGNENVAIDCTTSSTFSIYGRLTASNTTGAGRIMGFTSSGGAFLGAVRTHSTGGVFDVCNASAAQQATSGSVQWTVNQRYRIDVKLTISGLSNTVEVKGFLGSNMEGTSPDFTIGPVTYTTSSAIARVFFGGNIAIWSYGYDTIRVYDGVANWPAAYNPAPTGLQTDTAAISVSESRVLFKGNASAGTVGHNFVGKPTQTGFKVVTRTVNATSVQLAVSTASNMASPVYSSAVTPDANGYSTLVITGLSPNTRYYYQIADTPLGGTRTLIGNIDTAKTLVDIGSLTTFKVACGSCTLKGQNNGAAHADVVTWGPDFGVDLGDFYYTGSQSTDSSTFRALYEDMIETYPNMAAMRSKIAWFSATSDHEAGSDNGDSDNDWTDAQHEAYNQVVPHDNDSVRYDSWVVGRVRFILLDIRNPDRSPGLATDNSSKTMLGATQKAWLKARLVDTGEVKVILSDVGWMGAAATNNGEDKWWSYATERQEIIDYIAANNVKVDLWHGDSHAIAVASSTKNTWGNFPVLCCSPWAQDGGGRNLSTFDSYYNNSSGNARQYMRITFSDDGRYITRVASGWDAAAGVQRVSQTVVWDTLTTKSATETEAISVSDSSSLNINNVPVNKSTTDAAAISVSEASSAFKTIQTTDTSAISATETNSRFNTLPRTDTGSISVNDISNVSSTLPGTDNVAVSEVESRTIAVTLAATDATSVSVADTSAAQKNIVATDATAISTSETSAPFVTFVKTDASAVSVAEASSVSGSQARTDTSAISVSDAAAILYNPLTTDTSAVSVNDQSNVFVTVSRTDTSAVSVADASTPNLFVSRTDTSAVSVADASASNLSLTRNDAAAVSASDVSSGSVVAVASDAGTVSVSDISNVASTLPGTESIALSISEQVTLFVTQSRTDAAAVSVAESRTQAGTFSSTDATAVSVADNSTVFVTQSRTDAAAISASDASSSALTVDTDDGADVSVNDDSAPNVFVSKTDTSAVSVAESRTQNGFMTRTDAAAVSVVDTSSGFFTKVASDVAAVSVVDISNVSSTLPGIENVALAVSEQAVLFASQDTDDAVSVSVTEARTQAGTFSTTDTSAVSVAESRSIASTLTRTDTSAVSVAESTSGNNTAVASDTSALSVNDISSLGSTAPSTDGAAVAVTEARTISVTLSSTDAAAISVDDASSQLSTLSRTDSTSVAAFETNLNTSVENLAENPAATHYSSQDAGGWLNNRFGSHTAFSLVSGASDGPLPELTTYAHAVATTGLQSSLGFHLPDNPSSSVANPMGDIVVEPGQTYTLSVYVRASFGGGWHMSVRFQDAQGNWVGNTTSGSVFALSPDTWGRVSITITVPDGVKSMGFYVIQGGYTPAIGETFDGTGLMVTKSSTVLPYGDGNSAGWQWEGTPNASRSYMLTTPDLVVMSDRTDATALGASDTTTTYKQVVAAETNSLAVNDISGIGSTVPGNDAVSLAVTDQSTLFVTKPTTDTSSISIAESRVLNSTQTRTDTSALSINEIIYLNVTAQAADTTAISVSESRSLFVNASISAGDTGAVSVSESRTSALTNTASETNSLSVSETTAAFKQITTTDTAAVSVNDVAAVFEPLPGQDTVAVSLLSEQASVMTSGIFIVSATDSGSIACDETSDVDAFSTRADTGAVSVNDASAVFVTVSVAETDSLSVAESRAMASTLSRTDTSAVSVAEARTLNVQVSVTETNSLAASENSTFVRNLAGVDVVGVSIDEVSGIGSTLPGNDNVSIGVSEDIVISVVQAFADIAAISAAENDSLLVSFATTDTGAISTSEPTSSNSTVSRTDTTAISAVEARSQLVSQPAVDTSGLRISETTGGFVTTTTADNPSVSVTETNSFVRNIAVTDGAAVSVSETSTIFGPLPGQDTSALQIAESSNVVISGTILVSASESESLAILDISQDTNLLTKTDAAAISVADTSSTSTSGGFTVATADSAAVSVTEASSAPVFIIRSENPSLVISEQTSGQNTATASENNGLAVTETSSGNNSQVASDTGAISIADSRVLTSLEPRSDSGIISVTEQAGITLSGTVTVASTDSATLSALETPATDVTLSTADSGALSTTEQRQGSNTGQTSDTAAVSVVESRTLNSTLTRADTSAVSVTESRVFGTVSRGATDQAALSVVETSLANYLLPGQDVGSVRIDEASAIVVSGLIVVSSSDSLNISGGDQSNKNVNLTAYDHPTVAVEEDVAFGLIPTFDSDESTIRVSEFIGGEFGREAADHAALSVHESYNLIIRVGLMQITRTDAGGLGIRENDTVYEWGAVHVPIHFIGGSKTKTNFALDNSRGTIIRNAGTAKTSFKTTSKKDKAIE